eukprot:1784361-Pyramimonas_sp.AAC.1
MANWREIARVILGRMGNRGRRGNGASRARDLARAGAKLGSQAPDGVQKRVGVGPPATCWTARKDLLWNSGAAPPAQMEHCGIKAGCAAARNKARSSFPADFKTRTLTGYSSSTQRASISTRVCRLIATPWASESEWAMNMSISSRAHAR